MMGDTTGVVISSRSKLTCNVQYRNDGITASVQSSHCAASYMAADTRRNALNLVQELSALDGKSRGCALGGETFFVEGFVNHRRFVFVVSNPLNCNDVDSQLVTRLVDALRSKSPSETM